MFASVKLYGAIGIGVLVLLLVVFAGWEYDQRKLDALKMDALEGKLSTQAAVLSQLQEGVKADSAAIHDMAASAALNARHGSAVRTRVGTLEKSNAAIHSLLDTALPADGCLLDDTCADSGAASAPIGGAPAAVR